jgi:hypothetical protein
MSGAAFLLLDICAFHHREMISPPINIYSPLFPEQENPLFF